MVNREYCIPEDYEVNLVEVPGGEYVDERIYPALMEMFQAAEAEGVYSFVASGHRTQEKQQQLLDDKIRAYEREGYISFVAEMFAKDWVAIPGTSEHQLGIAVDINADLSRNTSEEVYGWLEQNAYKYGFIQRYPLDKTEITKILYEPWHYRYVGEEAAKEMYEKDLCLEEYIESLQQHAD